MVSILGTNISIFITTTLSYSCKWKSTLSGVHTSSSLISLAWSQTSLLLSAFYKNFNHQKNIPLGHSPKPHLAWNDDMTLPPQRPKWRSSSLLLDIAMETQCISEDKANSFLMVLCSDGSVCSCTVLNMRHQGENLGPRILVLLRHHVTSVNSNSNCNSKISRKHNKVCVDALKWAISVLQFRSAGVRTDAK
jgi:hypothetical protein